MQGAHHVAQKFTSSVLPVGFLRSAASCVASIFSSGTGSASIAFISALCSVSFSSHLIEQPTVGVFSTGTGVPASTASSARRASATFARASRGLLSTRPWYLRMRFWSKMKTCGVDTGPYFIAISCVSPSYRNGKSKFLCAARIFISSIESPRSV